MSSGAARATVVLATHNPRLDLFARQVRSLQEQTVAEWQCLVYDDHSTDRQAVQEMLAGDDRFELLPTVGHLGHNRAFEHLLTLAADHGLPVFLCDQDDAWDPKKLHHLLEELHSGAAGVFSAMRVVDDGGSLVRRRFLPRDPEQRWLRPASLLRMNCVSGTSLALSAETVRAALPFPDMQLRGWHDQWLAAVAARIGRLSYLTQPFTDYTQHCNQVMGDGLRAVNWQRMSDFVTKNRSLNSLLFDLRSRVNWIAIAAGRLLELSDVPDPELEALSSGTLSTTTTSWLWAGLRSGEVPVWRAALLGAGYAANSTSRR